MMIPGQAGGQFGDQFGGQFGGQVGGQAADALLPFRGHHYHQQNYFSSQ
jgi:hypothetical protein